LLCFFAKEAKRYSTQFDGGWKFMDGEKEVELSTNKVYALPTFQLIQHKGCHLAIAADLARWLVLKNDEQRHILNELINKSSIGDILEKFNDSQENVLDVLTQIEATGIETLQKKSIFSNTRLHLHLTNQCNLHCPHCYMASGAAYDDELSTKEIKELCANFCSIGGTHVSLTGGEPTIRSDFFEIVEHIHRLGMKTAIFSNGILWNEEKVQRISACDIEGVQISVDGYDEPSNAVVRGPGVFRRALEVIDLFISHRIYVKVAVTAPYKILKEHQSEYATFFKGLIEKYGHNALEINFSYFLMPGRELDASEIEETKEEYCKLVDQVVASIYGDMSEDSFVSNIIDGVYDSCGYGGLNVMANGDFYFCDRIPDVKKVGNIRNMPFPEIYRRMKIAEERGRIDYFTPCGSCELKYICGGGCRAEYFKEFTETEDITHVNHKNIQPRKCDKETKEKFYELMVKTYERFYC